MFAIILAPVYFLINFYIIRRSLQWIDAMSRSRAAKIVKIIFSTVYIFIMLTPLTSFLAPQSSLKWFLKYLNNFWLGFILYLLILMVLAEIVKMILENSCRIIKNQTKRRRYHILTGLVIAGMCFSVTLYGHYHAYNLKTVQYDIHISKNVEGTAALKIVMLADLHLGYNTKKEYLENLVDVVNQQQPDLVCIAGDIFDNEYEALKEPKEFYTILSRLESRYGVYGCYGNHDVDEKILAGFTFGGDEMKKSSQAMRDFLDKAGIRMLSDEAVLIDEKFYLAGRRDMSKTQEQSGERLTPQALIGRVDQRKPIIVMDHQPKEFQKLAQAGADLDLCGHTHNGQVFPANLVMKTIWEQPYGYLKKDNMHVIVTSGAGVWGPSMRVATDSEITVIRVLF